jgi:WD40 repeat protein
VSAEPGRVSPYQGLAPYLEDDAVFFFGRERERDLITANLMASRLTVLYGESGVGKSSVLHAGAAHHLHRLADQNRNEFGRALLALAVFNGWNEWRDDPARGVAQAVRTAVTRSLGGHAPPGDGAGLLSTVAAAAEAVDGDVMLVLDQFEEYFLYAKDSGSSSFETEFIELVNATSLPVSVLVSIREDSVTQIRRFKGRIPHLLDATLHVDHLDADAAREAIVEPVATYNQLYGTAVAVDPELVDAVLEDLARGSDDSARSETIETPYLQLVMTNLWDEERNSGSDELHVDTLRRLGTGRAILRRHLEARMNTLAPRDQAVAAQVFHHLVTPSGTKISHAVGDLAEYAEVPETRLAPVLEQLARRDAFILRATAPAADQVGGTRYEIFHDLLARPILEWRSRFREAAQRRRLVWRALGAMAALLLVALAAIAVAVGQRSRADEATEQKAQAQAAAAAAQRAVSPYLLGLLDAGAPVRRAEFSVDGRRAVAAAGDDAVVFSTGARGSSGAKPRSGADQNAAIAELASVSTLAAHSAVSTAAFGEGGTRVVTASTDGTARIWDVQTGQAVRELDSGGPVVAASFDISGKHVVTASADSTARIWPARGSGIERVLQHEGPVFSASFNRSGTRVVTASDDGTVRVWSVADGKERARLEAEDPRRASFSADGRLVIAVFGDHAWVWNPSTGQSVRLEGHRGRVLSAALSFDGGLAVTAGADGTVRVWDAATGRLLRGLTGHSGRVNRAVFGARATIVASAGDDGTGRISPLGRGKTQVLTGHDGGVNSIAFDRSGTRVLTAGADDTARLWRVEAPAEPVPVTNRLGQSVEGRPIELVRVGSRLTGRRVLVFGCMHGQECAGTSVTRRLARMWPTGFELLLVTDINPDGQLASTRGNARGVDLNRNFPYRWQESEPGSPEYSGTRPLSEPEARIAASLIRTFKPDVTIWYHQRSQTTRPPLIDESGGDVRIERRYANLVDLPLVERPRYPGSATTWQNVTFPDKTAFIVELRHGPPLTPRETRVHADAVLKIGAQLR